MDDETGRVWRENCWQLHKCGHVLKNSAPKFPGSMGEPISLQVISSSVAEKQGPRP